MELQNARGRRGSESKYNSSIFQTGIDNKYGLGGSNEANNDSNLAAEQMFKQNQLGDANFSNANVISTLGMAPLLKQPATFTSNQYNIIDAQHEFKVATENSAMQIKNESHQILQNQKREKQVREQLERQQQIRDQQAIAAAALNSLERDKLHRKFVKDERKRELDFATKQYQDRLQMEEEAAKMEKEVDLANIQSYVHREKQNREEYLKRFQVANQKMQMNSNNLQQQIGSPIKQIGA